MKKASSILISRNENRRIAYYFPSNQGFPTNLWDSHWADFIDSQPDKFYRRFMKGHLGHGVLSQALLKFLPRHAKILEAGCGIANYVVALRARGFDCIGVDSAPATVERIKNLLPGVPVYLGDVRHLNLESNSIGAYISLGVMEHFQDGPDHALIEARRVLSKKGILIVSIPHAFPWRRSIAYPQGTLLPENARFYQFAFPSEEFRRTLIRFGFEIQTEIGYGCLFAFRIRFKLVEDLHRLFPRLSLVDRLLDRTPMALHLGRMRLYVARKT